MTGGWSHESGVTEIGSPVEMSATVSEHVASNPMPLTKDLSIPVSRRTSLHAFEMQFQTA